MLFLTSINKSKLKKNMKKQMIKIEKNRIPNAAKLLQAQLD
jgi:hypothetical protein